MSVSPLRRSLQRKSGAGSLGAILLSLVLVAPTFAATWSDPVEIGPRPEEYSDVIAAVGPGSVASLYQDGLLYVRRSLDSGQTWSAGVPIPGSLNAVQPDMAGRGHHTDVVWVGPNCGVYYSLSNDDGASFRNPKKLSDSCPFFPRVSRGKNHLLAVSWSDGESAWARASRDGGTTFGPARRVARVDPDQIADYTMASVAAGDGIIYVAYNWDTGILRVKRSTDFGVTWSSALTVTTTSRYKRGWDIVAEGNSAVIAWATDAEARFRTTINRGATWTPDAQLADSAAPSKFNTRPDLCMKRGVVRAAYPTSSDVVMYRESPDGVVWSTPEDVGAGHLPRVACSGGGLALYSDSAFGGTLFVRRRST